MSAVGSYIKTLRIEQDIPQVDVIAHVSGRVGRQVDQTTIWRIERGKTKPRTDILSALLEKLGGSGDDVTALANDPHATTIDGRNAALRRLNHEEIERIDQLIDTTDPDDLAAVIEELREEYQRDTSLVKFLYGALAGWRARGSATRRRRE